MKQNSVTARLWELGAQTKALMLQLENDTQPPEVLTKSFWLILSIAEQVRFKHMAPDSKRMADVQVAFDHDKGAELPS